MDEIEFDGPVLIVLGGGFQVDHPEHYLIQHETDLYASFLDFCAPHVGMTRDEFKHVLCENLQAKLTLNDNICRKLLSAGKPTDWHSTTRTPVRIIHFTYSSAIDNLEHLRTSYTNPHHVSPDAQAFAEVLFTPLITGCQGNLDRLRQRFKKITFFCISYGSCFLIEVEGALRALLESHGVSEERHGELLESLSAIAVSNMSNAPNAATPHCRALFVEGANDYLAHWLNPHKLSGTHERRLRILAGNRVILAAPVPTTVATWIDVVDGLDFAKLENDRMGHYIPFYVLRTSEGSELPALLEHFIGHECFRSGSRTIQKSLHDELVHYLDRVRLLNLYLL